MLARRGWWCGLLLLIVGTPVRGEDSAAAIEARMRRDLEFLASDECEGRGPGTQGIDRAADYIADQFRQAGLRGGMPDGSFFQPFTVGGPARVGTPNSLTLRGPEEGAIDARFNADFAPIGASASRSVTGELVFAGYGISHPKLAYDDYRDLDVSGKVVLVVRKTPRYGDAKRPLADEEIVAEAASLISKIVLAEKRGAIGFVLVNDRATAKNESDALVNYGQFVGNRPVGIPALHLKRAAADRVVRAALGKSLDQIENAAEADLKSPAAALPGWRAAAQVTIERNRRIPVKNVIGVLDGNGPRKDETLVIGAHYDHLGFGGRGSLDPKAVNRIHHGADDNASGTTALIELARRFGANGDRGGRRIVFIAFSAEEMGLLGSVHYCKEPVFPLDKTIAMLNLDMVGKLRDDADTKKGKLDIGGTGTAKNFAELIDKHNEKYNFLIRKSASGQGPSDHASFYAKNLPVLFFFTGLHPDYHKPSDTAEKINVAGMKKIADMVEEIGLAVATADARPEFQKVAGSMRIDRDAPSGRPSGPRLGVMPSYDDEGLGMLLQGVSPGGLAEKAGLKEGDRIVEIGGKPVKNVQGYMAIMAEQKRGTTIEVVVLRKGERVTVKIAL